MLGNFRTLYWSCSLAVHYTMNSTTASARIRSISCFITSLSNSSSWRWVIHSAFGPYLAVNLINFVFMHADVLDVLPERINVSIGIKSCKVSCSFHCLFLRIISRWIRDVGSVGIEVTTAKYGTLLLHRSGLSEVRVLGSFSGWSERIWSFECSWRLHDSSCLSWLLFNRSSGSEGWFHRTLWIRNRAVEMIDEVFSRHVIRACFVWGGNSLA